MYGIGAQLRAERLKRKLALNEIAAETRISVRYLQAIEDEDYERLPGLIFTRSFVRQYAIALRVDPAPLVECLPKLDESMVQLPAPPANPPSSRWGTRPNPVLTSAAWVLLLGGAGVAAYYHFNGFPRLRIEVLPATQTATAQAASKAPVESPPPPDAAPPPEPAPIAAVNPPSVAPPAPVPSEHAVQVVLTALQTAWVQVTADGKPAWTGTLQPNETRAISADDQVRLLTGNAGGVVISLNGKTINPIGPVGQVRSIRLTADGADAPVVRGPAPDPL